VGSSRPFQVDVRVVAATNRDLLKEARQGRFRMDLYYRLSVVPLGLPPLRERRKDIRLLAEHFLRLYTPREQTVKFTPAALTRLEQHAWPGNVRELRNVVCRALLMRQSQKIVPDRRTPSEKRRNSGLPSVWTAERVASARRAARQSSPRPRSHPEWNGAARLLAPSQGRASRYVRRRQPPGAALARPPHGATPGALPASLPAHSGVAAH